MIFNTSLIIGQNDFVGIQIWKNEHCFNWNGTHEVFVTETNETLLAATLTFTKLFSHNHLNYLLCVGMLLETQSQRSLPPFWKESLCKRARQMGQHCSSAHITALFDREHNSSTQEMHIHASAWIKPSSSYFSLYRVKNMWHRRQAKSQTHDRCIRVSPSTHKHASQDNLWIIHPHDLIQNTRISISIIYHWGQIQFSVINTKQTMVH